jgi:septum site-determining protein MinC
MTDGSNTRKQAFKLKGTMPAITMLQVLTDDLEQIEAQLAEHISQMPQFFLHAPVLVDLEALEDKPFDLAAMARLLRERRLVPVAVRNPTELQRESAIAAGWGVLQAALGRPARAPAPAKAASTSAPPPEAPSAAPPEPPPAAAPPAEPPLAGLTIRSPVRSGQVVYAAGGDLVVLAPVSSGAELIADGNIHVYAAFRGRALAGVHDNPDASIFCMNLAAEFLSIAGRHAMADDIPEERRGKPARVHLSDDRIVISAI